MQGHKDLFFYFKNVIVLALRFQYLIHCECFYIWCKVGVQLHSFECGYPVVPLPFVEKAILSLLNCLVLV